ncbi:DUF2511 domain-containing protein [Pseudomonas sp. Y39-6]|uniref:DUF2511 domain-containing protein n=1 Tax=Pseudomonas sp. Y39-6 TaxID=2749807 RepID=UPI00191083BF|nr:DUF2511 domain-containing protein [Pseudomonas sp. Y39-6]QPO19595.1 DUF2511 domain-containing protein [Pseudomonas sp. Y39-6]URS62717.1 DUF2511 domain-containing protein [Pseudomonas sp. Y39-6]
MNQGNKVLILISGLLLSLTSVADGRERSISSADFGEAWPFTVDSVDLMCDGPSPKALARTSDGTVYALNGSARTIAKSRGWADGQDITKPNPSMPAIKMDYSNFVQIAQDLCPKP